MKNTDFSFYLTLLYLEVELRYNFNKSELKDIVIIKMAFSSHLVANVKGGNETL